MDLKLNEGKTKTSPNVRIKENKKKQKTFHKVM